MNLLHFPQNLKFNSNNNTKFVLHPTGKLEKESLGWFSSVVIRMYNKIAQLFGCKSLSQQNLSASIQYARNMLDNITFRAMLQLYDLTDIATVINDIRKPENFGAYLHSPLGKKDDAVLEEILHEAYQLAYAPKIQGDIFTKTSFTEDEVQFYLNKQKLDNKVVKNKTKFLNLSTIIQSNSFKRFSLNLQNEVWLHHAIHFYQNLRNTVETLIRQEDASGQKLQIPDDVSLSLMNYYTHVADADDYVNIAYAFIYLCETKMPTEARIFCVANSILAQMPGFADIADKDNFFTPLVECKEQGSDVSYYAPYVTNLFLSGLAAERTNEELQAQILLNAQKIVDEKYNIVDRVVV